MVAAPHLHTNRLWYISGGKTFAIGQLRKRHDQVLIETTELLHIAFALIMLNISAKGIVNLSQIWLRLCVEPVL